MLTDLAEFGSVAQVDGRRAGRHAGAGSGRRTAGAGRSSERTGRRHDHRSRRRSSPSRRVLLAPNPGPMTLDGTNSYLLSAPGSASSIVVDPGSGRRRPPRRAGRGGSGGADPDHPSASRPHRGGRRAGAADRGAGPGRRPGALHRRRTRCATARSSRRPASRCRVIATPGHTDDSVSFLLAADGPTGSVLTGDTILGRGTTVIAPPDGSLGAYLASLRSARRSRPAVRAAGARPAAAGPVRRGGGVPGTPRAAADRDPRRAGTLGPDASVGAVTDAVYDDIDPSVRFAAEHSVAAQLEYLRGSRTRTRRATVTDRRHAPPGLDGVLPLLACPHCSAALARDGGVVGCPAGHRFDVARQGYLSLLGAASRTDTGDSADMVAARAAFLGDGHYRPLADAIADRVEAGPVLEIGAGTGYYLGGVLDRLAAPVRPDRSGWRSTPPGMPRAERPRRTRGSGRSSRTPGRGCRSATGSIGDRAQCLRAARSGRDRPGARARWPGGRRHPGTGSPGGDPRGAGPADGRRRQTRAVG